MIIYKATNKINGKIYIGQTSSSLKIRKGKHRRYAKYKKENTKFYNAIRKYGFDSFTFEIIEKCKSKQELNEREIYYISFYDSYKNGYNSTLGGEGVGGGKLHHFYGKKRPEFAKSISGRGHPNFGKVGELSPRWGQHHTNQTKRQISKSLQGKLNGNKNSSYDSTVFRFVHDVLGMRECTKYELRKEFGLDSKSMSQLCRRKISQHNGWKMICCVSGTDSQLKQKCGEALRIVSGKTERVIKSLNHKTKKLIKRGNPLALAGG